MIAYIYFKNMSGGEFHKFLNKFYRAAVEVIITLCTPRDMSKMEIMPVE